MNEKTEFNFVPYRESETDRFIAEYPVIRPMKCWFEQCGRQWDGSNPSIRWTTYNFQKSKEESSPYYSLEWDLWVVGGSDSSFLLAKFENSTEIKDSKAINFLMKLNDEKWKFSQKSKFKFDTYREIWRDVKESDLVDAKEIYAEILLTTGIRTRTNKHGDLYSFGSSFHPSIGGGITCSKEERDYYRRQMSKLTGIPLNQ